MSFQNVSTDVSPGRKLAGRFPFTKAVLAVLAAAFIAPAMFDGNDAQAQTCMATDPPTCSLRSWAPLSYPQNLQVFNVYLDDQWDQRPDHANFQISAIDAAVTSLIESQYFDAAHQYGVPNISFAGSTNTNRFFMACPHRLIGNNLPGIFQQIACMESQPLSGLPMELAVPTPNCQLCALAPNGCLFDPLSLCLATPNTTGNTIYNIFVPHDTILDDFGIRSCQDYGAYHMQVPSLPFLGILGTQGRPLYITVIPTACASTVQQLMAAVSHEMIEAVTNPLPVSHWIESSFTPPIPTILTDPTRLLTSFMESEPADICQGRTAPIYPGSPQAFSASRYWSNADGACFPRVAQARISTDVGPGVANTPDGVLFLAKDPQGRIFTNRRVFGRPAQGWLELPGNGRTNAAPAAATVRGTNYLYAAVKGVDGYVYLNQGNIGDPHVGWRGAGFQTDVAPAVASTQDGVIVFAKDLQGRIFSNRYILGLGGQGWREVEGGGLASAAPAAALISGIPYVFVAIRGLDGYVYYNQGNIGIPYLGWQRAGTDLQTDVAPAVASTPDGVVLYAKNLQGRVFSNRIVIGQAPQGWREVEGNGSTDASPAAATVGTVPFHFVAVKGMDWNVWTNLGMQGGPYMGWGP